MPEAVSSGTRAALARVLREKRRGRRRLARLPIEEKVKIVVELQKATNEIRRSSGRLPLREWRI